MMSTYLTVDDAPSNDLPQKLAVLEEYEVPALFFCEGRRLADHPEHARLAVETGYHLGNHTYSHRYASDLSVDTFRDEIAQTESLLENVYETASMTRPAQLFRFPFGDKGSAQSEQFQRILEEKGFVPPDSERISYEWYDKHHAGDRDWFWTFGVEDWAMESGLELKERVKSSVNRLDSPCSDIVLFHDASNTTDLFEYFIELLLGHGIEFANPLDLLA